MRVLLFGTGEFYQYYKKWFQNVEVVALLDNDKLKQGSQIDGLTVLSPQDGLKESFDRIYILSIYSQEIKEQLLNLGVFAGEIFTHDDIYVTLKDYLVKDQRKFIAGKNCSSMDDLNLENKLVLLSFDLKVNGAAIALLEVAKILINNNYDVVVATMQDGPIRNEFTKLGIEIIIDDNLRILPLDKITWLRKVKCIFINTMHFYNLFRTDYDKKNIIWWLHEPPGLYKGRSLTGIDFNGATICAVSKIAKQAFLDHCVLNDIQKLPLGINDNYCGNKIKTDKIVFAVIGGICQLKGQDIFIEAINKLDICDREKCEFWLIGNNTGTFANIISEKIQGKNNVKIFGELNREKMIDIYRSISVVVCSSWQECLPSVAIEGMMNYIPCIVTDSTGIAEYVREKENGLICRTGDANDLAEKMSWVIKNKSYLPEMSTNARDTYEKYFSLEMFRNRLLAIVESQKANIQNETKE